MEIWPFFSKTKPLCFVQRQTLVIREVLFNVDAGECLSDTCQVGVSFILMSCSMSGGRDLNSIQGRRPVGRNWSQHSQRKTGLYNVSVTLSP